MSEVVRVLRVLEYIGQRSWVESTVENSIQGTKDFGLGVIRAATVGSFPEVIGQLEVEQAETITVGADDNALWCRICECKFAVLTEHRQDKRFFCPHCGSVVE